MDNSVAPTSTPRVGCSAISTGAWWDSSRATTIFCRLPPDNVPTCKRSLPIRMANFWISYRARSANADGSIKGPRARRAAAMESDREIVGCARRRRRTDHGAVLGDIGNRPARGVPSLGHRHVAAVLRDAAAVRMAQTDQRLDQFGLTVARDACDPDDLAGLHRQRSP